MRTFLVARIRLRGRARQRGAVFLICLVLVSLPTLTASSFSLAGVDGVEVARDGN